MFFDDYCFCWNSDRCPHKNECIRAEKKVGTHTYSSFYDKNKECEYFLKKEEYDGTVL